MTDHNETDPIRQEIRAAMTRILEGRPQRTAPGKFTVMDLVREAAVKRHYLTHRHRDLAGEFEDEVARLSATGISETEAALANEVEALKEALGNSQNESARWRNQAHDYKRIIQVLVKERDALIEKRDSLQRQLDQRPQHRDPTVLRAVPPPEER